MVTVKSSGVHGDENVSFQDLEEAKAWIYSQHWSLSDHVTVEDAEGNEIFAEDAVDIRWKQVAAEEKKEEEKES